MSLSAGHHSFHEVMRGAQLALDSVPGHDPALDYQDNWGRYWNVYPLTEQELRDRVALGRPLPRRARPGPARRNVIFCRMEGPCARSPRTRGSGGERGDRDERTDEAGGRGSGGCAPAELTIRDLVVGDGPEALPGRVVGCTTSG